MLNPIQEEESQLRSSSCPRCCGWRAQNLRRQVERVRIFEVSRVFRPVGAASFPREPLTPPPC